MSHWTRSMEGARARARRALRGVRRPAATRMAVALLLMLPGLALSSRPEPAPDYASAPADDPVAAAWRQGVLDRERQALSAWFADRFEIAPGLASEIYRAAEEEGVEPGLAFHLVRVESSFRRTAVSHAGAVGYTQVLPSTARWLVPTTTRAQLFQPETNLRIGFRYLRYLLDYYDGDVRLALTAYNRGPGTVDRLLRSGRDPENGYARRVLGS